MIADTFRLDGRVTVTPSPAVADRAFQADVSFPVLQTFAVTDKHTDVVDLIADAPVVLPLGGLENVHVLALRSDQPVTLSITTAKGTSQLLPLDSIIWVSKIYPILSASLVRDTGVATRVHFLLCET